MNFNGRKKYCRCDSWQMFSGVTERHKIICTLKHFAELGISLQSETCLQQRQAAEMYCLSISLHESQDFSDKGSEVSSGVLSVYVRPIKI